MKLNIVKIDALKLTSEVWNVLMNAGNSIRWCNTMPPMFSKLLECGKVFRMSLFLTVRKYLCSCVCKDTFITWTNLSGNLKMLKNIDKLLP